MTSDADASLVRRYYRLFNERRLAEAAALVADSCEFEHRPTKERALGPRGYLLLVSEWLQASPDLFVTVDDIVGVEAGLCRVSLRVSGHVHGEMAMGPGVRMAADGQPFSLRATHDIRVRNGRIVSTSLTYDPTDLTERSASSSDAPETGGPVKRRAAKPEP